MITITPKDRMDQNQTLIETFKSLPDGLPYIFRGSGGIRWSGYTEDHPYETTGLLLKEKNSYQRAFFPFIGEPVLCGGASSFNFLNGNSIQPQGWIITQHDGLFIPEDTIITLLIITSYQFR